MSSQTKPQAEASSISVPLPAAAEPIVTEMTTAGDHTGPITIAAAEPVATETITAGDHTGPITAAVAEPVATETITSGDHTSPTTPAAAEPVVTETTTAGDHTGPTTAGAGADDIIEVGNRADPDADEGYQAELLSSATTSVSSSVRNHVFENNRRYHKFQEGRYLIPNDDEEQEREDMKHALVLHLCGGRLHLAPLNNPQRVLDIGTGTGIWAIDMGDEYPGAEITGIDLSPIQPSWIPPNVKFIIDDAEAEWVYPPNSLDYVHLRHMALTIKDMRRLLAEAYKALKPGGWIELQDFLYITYSDDGSKPDGYKYDEFVKLLREGFLKFGFDLHGQQKNEGMIKDTGFVNVDNKMYKVPIGAWPKKEGLNQAGLYNKAIALDFLRAVQAPFTRGLGWSPGELEVFLVDVRKSLCDTNIHTYYTFHMVIGQKPLDAA